MSNDRDDDYDERLDGEFSRNPMSDLSPFADGTDSDDGTDDDGYEGTNLSEDSDYDFEDSEYLEAATRTYQELLSRTGEANPRPRLGATRRVVELLGDPHRAYPIIHITGTNGKTSTSRITESILRAYGLRTGMLTSPHLTRVNERIMIDGVPISNRAFVANWEDIRPYVLMVDAELVAAGDPELSFFEALTVLAFASFADAPVDVAVIEVGIGGEWDSTNVADGQVAVLTPIALDHTQRLGNTVAEIARTKAGIIKPAANVVSAAQSEEALAELQRAAELSEATLAVAGSEFGVENTTMAVGGQVISVRGLAGTYRDLFLPLFGDYQAQNAALAIAAVESFLGAGTQPLVGDVLAEGLATATSPGRLQLIGTAPSVVVDAAHNPHGALALASAVTRYFTFSQIAVVLGVLGDKDARGIISALAPIASRFYVTASQSDRAVDRDALSDLVREIAGDENTITVHSLADALADARGWASEEDARAVLVTGSITLIGEAIVLAKNEGWK